MPVKRQKGSKIYYTNFTHNGQRVRKSCGTINKVQAQEYEDKIKEVCERINESEYWLSGALLKFPSIHFGLETAILDLKNKGSKILFLSEKCRIK